MRCCIETAVEYDGPEEAGVTVIDCTYEPPGNGQVRLAADGVWEWNHD